ncbi:MAG: hypothetical protein WBK91_05575 [Alphaproteobacteria bacterium]
MTKRHGWLSGIIYAAGACRWRSRKFWRRRSRWRRWKNMIPTSRGFRAAVRAAVRIVAGLVAPLRARVASAKRINQAREGD